MGAPRTQRNLLKSRRRVANDVGEEEGSTVGAEEDDSFSEGSIISEVDDDADAESSDESEVVSASAQETNNSAATNGHHEVAKAVSTELPQAKKPLQEAGGDTAAMLHGLQISDVVNDEGVDFNDLNKDSSMQPEVATSDSQQQHSQVPTAARDRVRQDHEEYKQRRDADPAFVPNRGGFFMHDHRSAVLGQTGFRPSGRGRARGRGNGPYVSHSQMHPSGPADAPWAHDLHEAILHEQPPQAVQSSISKNLQDRQKPPIASSMDQPPNRSFSGDKHLGNVQMRVLINGMSAPVIFAAVPVFQHTRLPHHRPPLRRDKPVRISLPEASIRYIFPATNRSFIFIPRALRPNQQGLGRRSFGVGNMGLGQHASRRTSVNAWSGYSPSVAVSRRSSLAREVTAEALSPSKSSFSRPSPVVRLPPTSDQMTPAGGPDAANPTRYTADTSQTAPHSIVQNATYHENRPGSLPMFHPKPERTLQVGDIESPATFEFNPPQAQQQQPFHQQVPQLGPLQADASNILHSRHPSHASHNSTPLQQIPENVVHAQSFQPFPYQQHPGFYPQSYQPPMYYYPPTQAQALGTAAAAPPFVPGQPYFYPMQIPMIPQPPVEDASGNQAVPYESGGMVYYYNAAELSQGADHSSQQAHRGYAPPMGMGGMMTPPMQYYPAPLPPPASFYPQQPPQPPQQ